MKKRTDVTITLDHQSLLVLVRYGLTVALNNTDGILDYNLPGIEAGTVVYKDGVSDTLYLWRAYALPFRKMTVLVAASVEGKAEINDKQFVIVVELDEDTHVIKQVFEAENDSGPILDVDTMSITFGFA